MLRICRAEDGYSVEVEWDGARSQSLEQFLSTHTGVPPESIVAYTGDGKRVQVEGGRLGLGLAGLGIGGSSSTPTPIYVFNKQYLEMSIQDVIRTLHVDADVALLTSTPTSSSSSTLATLRTLHTAMHTQHAALLAASRNLALNVLAVTDVWSGIQSAIKTELDRQALLVRGVRGDLEIIKGVKVHPLLLGAGRTLGDYVSAVKMEQVREACRRANDELTSRWEAVRERVGICEQGAAEVGAAVERDDRTLDVVDDIMRQTEGGEQVVRDLVDAKNSHTRECISLLKRITEINLELTQSPPMMAALQASFRPAPSQSQSQSQMANQMPPLNLKNFAHLHRLHSMLFAYGATLVEIVRRREFEQFFAGRVQGLVEVFAKMTSTERKRRSLFRSEVGGLLPFEVPGMDASVAVPAVEIDVKGLSGSVNGSMSPLSSSVTGEHIHGEGIGRAEIRDFMHLLDTLEGNAPDEVADEVRRTIRETRAGMEKMIGKMDGVEKGWERVVERGLLTGSSTSHSRRRSEADTQAYNDVVDELRRVDDERRAVREELERAKRREEDRVRAAETDARNAQADCVAAREDLSALQEELSSVRELADGTQAELVSTQAELASVRSEARQTEDRLREEKSRVREYERVVQERDRDIRDHLAEADGDRAVLERDRAMLRDDNEGFRRELQETRLLLAEKTRAIDSKTQEMEAVKDELEEKARQLEEVKGDLEVATGDAVGLRKELARVESLSRERGDAEDHRVRDALRQLREADVQLENTERRLREQTDRADKQQRLVHDLEHKLEGSERLVAQLVDVGLAFRAAHVKVMGLVQGMVVHPGTRHSNAPGDASGSGSLNPDVRNSLHLTIPGDIEEPLPATPDEALELLRAFDHDVFVDAVNRVGGVLRKWMKQCKEYRERSKGRISFRNFGKGDLALFLPTRGSGGGGNGVEGGKGKGWAAFNVFFPHYFLQATGHLAEQLKTREWIVARITEITERVVDRDDPSSNPYGLSDGVKYYMLQVEDWTQTPPGGVKGSVRRKSRASETGTLPGSTAIPAPLTSPGAFLRSSPETASGPPEASFLRPPPEAAEITPPDVEDTFPPPPDEGMTMGVGRVSGSPTRGRPSSLSRLLAQADEESDRDREASAAGKKSDEDEQPASQSSVPRTGSSIPRTASPVQRRPSPLPRPASPVSVQKPPVSPSKHVFPTQLSSSPQQIPGSLPSSTNVHSPHQPSLSSPLRPGSRASKTSSASRFSLVGGKLPIVGAPGGVGKAAATTATTTVDELETPSPNDSISEGLNEVRRRTLHERAVTTAGITPSTSATDGTARGTLASLASSWGVAFGERRNAAAEEQRKRRISSGTERG
ncbi:hypothetical protein BDZ89DRAFT_1065230 [Hymenopellis radicata]|nr:hypothetical protein BDZ89DRAFT_1065230 [Hymenopellis radicata]